MRPRMQLYGRSKRLKLIQMQATKSMETTARAITTEPSKNPNTAKPKREAPKLTSWGYAKTERLTSKLRIVQLRKPIGDSSYLKYWKRKRWVSSIKGEGSESLRGRDCHQNMREAEISCKGRRVILLDISIGGYISKYDLNSLSSTSKSERWRVSARVQELKANSRRTSRQQWFT